MGAVVPCCGRFFISIGQLTGEPFANATMPPEGNMFSADCLPSTLEPVTLALKCRSGEPIDELFITETLAYVNGGLVDAV